MSGIKRSGCRFCRGSGLLNDIKAWCCQRVASRGIKRSGCRFFRGNGCERSCVHPWLRVPKCAEVISRSKT